MSIRVFNRKRTRRIEAQGSDHKDFMILKAFAFEDVPEKYTSDITFRLGVQSGEIEIIETRKQEQKVEQTADKAEVVEEAPKAKKTSAKKGDKK